MDSFRSIIKKRKRLLIAGVTLILILNICLLLLDRYYFRMNSRVELTLSFLIGLVIALLLLGVLATHKYTKVLKNEDSLKRLYIDEHDERKKLIKDKTAKSTVITGTILLIIATSVAIYFEPIVAMTLIGVMYVMVVIMLIFKVYYSKKF